MSPPIRRAPNRGLVSAPGLLLVVAWPGQAVASESTPVRALGAVVFYDENGNGALDASERVRIPGAVLEMAGRTARSEKGSGRAVLAGVPAGRHSLSVRGETLPPFYAAGAAVPVDAPSTTEVAVPVTLPIGSNRQNTYMALGDSITDGDGSTDETGFRSRLESALRAHFGHALVLNEGVQGADSHRGARRAPRALARHRPAFTLILYGTNDWSERPCDPVLSCSTVNNLRRIVREVKAQRGLPFLATVPPTNSGFDDDVPPMRNDWLRRTNERIRALAHEEGAVLVDVEAALLRAGPLAKLFADGIHPNDAGYAAIAAAFFRAITSRPGAEGDR